jgi:hypothetical protein
MFKSFECLLPICVTYLAGEHQMFYNRAEWLGQSHQVFNTNRAMGKFCDHHLRASLKQNGITFKHAALSK